MKKLVVLLAMLVLALPFSVEAHTTLTSSTPAEGEMITEPLEEIQLVFGTAVEQGSKMELQGESASYEFESIEITDNTMKGTISEELPNGAYTVKWNIIGEDGHPIEGEYSFGVNVETAEEVPPAEEESVAEEPPVEENQPAADETAQTTTSSESGSNLFVTVLIAAAAVLLIVGLYGLLKKKS
ncbi:copper resistance CopC family protein [Planococcus sp. YIM B11945]|uniref:copper resistance CopC family protein n=1 Tax=Planococcus sp. YIM B11945 TaxID=3435410 RepID=UPI003D7DFCAD